MNNRGGDPTDRPCDRPSFETNDLFKDAHSEPASCLSVGDLGLAAEETICRLVAPSHSLIRSLIYRVVHQVGY